MNSLQIIECLENLAQSQGFYGRLLENLDNLSVEEYDKVMNTLEGQNFKDMIDLVMYFEC